MAVKFTNNASTTLAAELSSGAGSGTFTSNTGFPDISGSGDYYYVTIGTDVLKITAVSGQTWTLGSNATSTYANGSVVELRMSSEVLEDVRTEASDALTSHTDSTNSHIDWTTDQGATNIHAGNYINTTYGVGDGGLTEKNFTSTLKTKLDGVADSANNYSLPEASGTVSGGVKVGANLTMTNGVLAAGGGVESGTTMMFYQASAPTGWTQDTTASLDGRALRVETGQGGGSGGSHDLASPPSTSHSHSTPSHSHSHTLSAGSHTLTTSQMPSHNHTLPIYWSSDSAPYNPKTSNGYSTSQKSSGNSGGSASHSHSLAGSITSGGSGTSGSAGGTAFAPKYVNVIICSKD